MTLKSKSVAPRNYHKFIKTFSYSDGSTLNVPSKVRKSRPFGNCTGVWKVKHKKA